MSEHKVCLITGVGPGTGRALVECFAAGGYTVAMLARSEDRLTELADSLPNAHAYPCDVASRGPIEETVAKIKADHGAPSVVIHNAVGGAFGTILELDAATLERNFQINTMALFHLAQLTLPDMVEAGHGVLLGTGNTSAYRGKPNFVGFAPTKAAQRILLEGIARDMGPKGVHAAYVAIDAVIDVPWTRKMMPDRPDDFFAKPVDIAEQCYMVAHQPKSTWASDIVIRPFGESW